MDKTVCINTIARNSEDTLEFCLGSVIPYATRVLITIDSRSTDRTLQIAKSLESKYGNVEVDVFKIENPLRDLVKMRNYQLAKVTEDYVWIVDSDEYYPKESMPKELVEDIYAFRLWSPWNQKYAHRATTKPFVPRVFRIKEGLQWIGKFGKERLGNWKLDRVTKLDLRYIHLTHLKKDAWRKEMGKERKVDGKFLVPMPLEVSKVIKQFYEQRVQNM